MNIDYVFIHDDGSIHFAPEEDGFRQGVEWLRLLCREKLLDIACITQGSNLWGAKVNEGTAGYFSYWRLSNTVLPAELAAQFECMLPVAAQGYPARLTRLSDVVEFGASLTVQNKNIPASLRWLDAQMDTETMLVSQNGPMGDMLRLNDDGRYEVVYVPGTNELYSIVPVICGQFFAPAKYYESIYVPAPHREEKTRYSKMYEAADVLEKESYRTLTYAMPMTSSESARLLQLHTQLKTAIDRALVDFMTNGVTDESYAAFEQSLKDIGSEEYKAIYQAAYDRYLTRQEVAAQ